MYNKYCWASLHCNASILNFWIFISQGKLRVTRVSKLAWDCVIVSNSHTAVCHLMSVCHLTSSEGNGSCSDDGGLLIKTQFEISLTSYYLSSYLSACCGVSAYDLIRLRVSVTNMVTTACHSLHHGDHWPPCCHSHHNRLVIDRFSYEILQILLPGHCCQDKLDSSVVSDFKIWDLHKMNRMVQLVEGL